MKRTLVLAAVAAAAAFVPAPAALADHVCITRGGEPVVCTPHPEDTYSIKWPEQVCVKVLGRDIVCVF